MNNKITTDQLQEIINQVREETKIDFTELIQEIYGPKRSVPLQEFVDEILPRLLSATFVKAGNHAELIVHDVLDKLDLIKKDD